MPSFTQQSTQDALHRKLASSAREMGELSLENNDLRRELIRVLEQDRRDWHTQPQTQQLLADNEELRASIAALERLNAENVELENEIAAGQAALRRNARAVEEQRDTLRLAEEEAHGAEEAVPVAPTRRAPHADPEGEPREALSRRAR